jgi:murein DD-endopeptidase MepM/ murein hydrolase activator NlpD
VTQGYNGSYSHSGPDQYAIDFKMPPGTPVHAARGGRVVKVKEDSDQGGPSRKFESCANYILIRHDDGTLANYAHLQQASSSVKAGDVVEAGDLLALSGNTGFTSGPHLHFSVFKTRADGRGRQSLPVKFKTLDSARITLKESRSYKPCSIESRSAQRVVAAKLPKDDSKDISAGAPERN